MGKNKVIQIGNEDFDPNTPFMQQASIIMKGLEDVGVDAKALKEISSAIQRTIVENVPDLTLGKFNLYFSMIYAFMIDSLLATVNHHDEKLADGALAFLYKTLWRLCDARDMLDENGNLKE